MLGCLKWSVCTNSRDRWRSRS